MGVSWQPAPTMATRGSGTPKVALLFPLCFFLIILFLRIGFEFKFQQRVSENGAGSRLPFSLAHIVKRDFSDAQRAALTR